MTRQEAISLVYGNPEAAVDLIFQLSEAVEILKTRVAELERKIALLTRDSSKFFQAAFFGWSRKEAPSPTA